MSNVEQVRRRVQTYVYLSLSPTADKRGDAGELKCLSPFHKYRLGALAYSGDRTSDVYFAGAP